jgi:hypothetical protein
MKKAISSPKVSKHAQRRLQQRGISEDVVRLIEAFGRFHYQKGGSELAYIDNKRVSELRKALDKVAGVQLVISESNKVVTAMHQTRRARTTQYVA